MPGPRQPTDLIVDRGKKHLSKAEEAKRRSQEPKVKKPKTATPPKWLPEPLKTGFRKLGKQLIAAGIYTGLDADTLGRYLVAHQEWLRATQYAQAGLEAGDLEETEAWGRVQDRYFKQARNCANDLGLTVTSRCRIVIPEGAKQQTEDSNPFLQLIEGGRAGNG